MYVSLYTSTLIFHEKHLRNFQKKKMKMKMKMEMEMGMEMEMKES